MRAMSGMFTRFPDGIIIHSFTLPQERWITLLSIAHRYEFLNVRERAIDEIYGPFRAQQKRWVSMSKDRREEDIQQELQQHDYQLLISVAEKYDVPLCPIVPLLLPFVVRQQPMTVKEVKRFSALTMTRLAHAREDFLRLRKISKSGIISDPDAEEIVYRIWQIQNDD
jgi:hypothetical protein